MSLTFSRYARVIFHVCPVLSLRVISLHLPSCRLVSLRFVSLSFPLHSFSFLSLSCPFQFPFVSLSFPIAFLTCGLPISSPHFLALPCISPFSPVCPAKKHCFFQRFQNTELFQIFPCTSLHFPLAPQYFPQKHCFSSVFAKRTSTNTEFFQIFCKSKQETQTSKKPAGGIEPGWGDETLRN